MIQVFFYNPICDPLFRFFKQKRYFRYINIYFEKKCRQLKKSPEEAPFVIIVFGFILWFFISFLAKLPIWTTEIFNIAAWGLGIPFVISASVALHTNYSRNEIKLLLYKKIRKILFLLLLLSLGCIFYYQNEENILYQLLGGAVTCAAVIWIFLLVLDVIAIVVSKYVYCAYKYVEKDLSAEYVWKIFKNLFYTLITLLILSLLQWIYYH